MPLTNKHSKKDAASSTSDTVKVATTKKSERPNIFRRIGGYFKGSWQELRGTRWPTRKATWSLTVAVIIFTTFIMLFIVGIDYVFDMLFQRLIL